MTLNLPFKSLLIWAGSGILLLAIVVAIVTVPRLREGLTIVFLKARGSLPDVGWTDLYQMAQPGKGHFNLPVLAEDPDPYTAILNSYGDPADALAGGKIFAVHCAVCHGANGSGGHGGPTLQHRQMVNGSSDWALFRTITYGIAGTAMPPNGNISWRDRWRLVAYVKSLMLRGHTNKNAVSRSAKGKAGPVTYKDILSARENQDEWLTYSGAYNSERFSPLNQITAVNVAQLRLQWIRQYSTSGQLIETTPLVVGGYMFLTVPPNRVEALNAKTGRLIWSYNRNLPDHLPTCCGYVNRGLAVLGNTLFFGTLDAHLVALNMKTGRVRWDVKIADYKQGYSITGAPLALKNMVVTGVAGGEYGIRGFIDARNAETGKELWKFYTIPGPGQPGSNTWEGDSWETGGAPTWTTGSFDPDTNLIFWPIGNPSPDYNGQVRKGDNLYSDCVLALDANNGKLRWYFQFTPHDVWDWDGAEIVLLFDKTVDGKAEHYLAQADRNGFYYLLDRDTGRFILARPFAKQTWAESIGSAGYPMVNPASLPTKRGTVVYPGGEATNWMSPSYSPLTGMVYIPVRTRTGTFYRSYSEFHRGEPFYEGSLQGSANPQAAVIALNALTGEQQWKYSPNPNPHPGAEAGGLLNTAGNVLFGSLSGSFFALDARTGHKLWGIRTNKGILAAPITFVCDGQQMVTIASGQDILTFSL